MEQKGAKKWYQRSVSLQPQSAAQGPTGSLIENPLYRETDDDLERGGGGGGGGNGALGPVPGAGQGQGPKVLRQVSEPASNKHGINAFTSALVARTSSAKSIVKKTTADFFGINHETTDDDCRLSQERRLRMLTRKYGKLKEPASSQGHAQAQAQGVTPPRVMYSGNTEQPPTPWVGGDRSGDVVDGGVFYSTDPHVSTPIVDIEFEEPFPSLSKDPVYKLTWSGIAFTGSTLKKKLTNLRKKKKDLNGDQETDEAAEGDETEEHEPDEADGDSHHHHHLEEDFISENPGSVESVDGVKRRRPTEALSSPSFYSAPTFGPSFFVSRLLDRKLKKSLTKAQKEAIDHLDDHRPYFTYWITTVQILILLISILAYGFGPSGFSRTQKSGLVLVTSLSLQQVDYFEPDNFWLGPRAADLIHLGAKFSPCMRRDRLVFEEIEKERAHEKGTACCVRNDESGCVQTQRDKCSSLLSNWRKWGSNNPGPPRRVSRYKTNFAFSENRTSGPVCGQDPRYCEEPASAYPYEWPDDITKWPVCKKPITGRVVAEEHMACEVIGRPCCIGIYGECRITTREYCDFVKGSFHEEATLCSQVSCMADICGMIPFYSSDTPDQFYRLWMSLFLHAGIFHLLITVVFQYCIMRDIEKLTGSLRIALIYLFSGIGGNLASAIFVPYRAEVGPAGSQFALLACLIVEVINSWEMIENPRLALSKLLLSALALFALGLLPWVDNYAHIMGFVIGFFLSLALLPYLTLTPFETQKKLATVCGSLLVVVVVLVALFLTLYIFPVYDCKICQYLNCIPFGRNWCANQDIKITRDDVL